MYLIHEDLARAHMDARLEEARVERRVAQAVRAQRAAKRAERKPARVRFLPARAH